MIQNKEGIAIITVVYGINFVKTKGSTTILMGSNIKGAVRPTVSHAEAQRRRGFQLIDYQLIGNYQK